MSTQLAFLSCVKTSLFGFLLLVIAGNALAQEETKGDVQSLQRPKPGSAESKASPAKPGDEDAEEDIESSKKEQKKDEGWKPLLPKDGLKGWEITDFGIEGSKVTNKDGQLLIELGDPLNGINYKGKDFPTDNFEIYLEANRLEGNDFLVGLTFPIAKQHSSLIAGGWGGTLVGLSSVDDFDASENATTTFFEFENKKWYRFKLRVDQEYVRAWIDDEEIFRQEREDHEFSTRIEVESSKPLGFCAFMSKVAVRDFKWRSIDKEKSEKKKTEKKSKGGTGQAVEPIQ